MTLAVGICGAILDMLAQPQTCWLGSPPPSCGVVLLGVFVMNGSLIVFQGVREGRI